MKKRKTYGGCELESPIYRQVLKEKSKGYIYVQQSNHIVKVKKTN